MRTQPFVHAITIGILTDFRRPTIEDLLNELLLQIQPCDEILVLNTSTASIPSRLQSLFDHPQINCHEYDQGPFDFSRARNQVIRLVATDALAFIDDDAFPLPGWLDRIRINLTKHLVSGGPTLPADSLPLWWNHAVNWTIGLSPPDTALGKPGNYPDTSNTAALLSYWKAHPFQELSTTPRSFYESGGEDAEWWTRLRTAGNNATLDWRQAVCHPVHTDRLSPVYQRKRATADGHSSWQRRPHYHRATAIPWDFMHTAGLVLDDFTRHPFNRHRNQPNRIWLLRQWGFLKSVWGSPPINRPAHYEAGIQLARAGLFQAKLRMGRAAFHIIKRARFNPDFPPKNPRRLYVSGHCLLGDTILLRRHIQSLAATFPNAEIHVPSRYPSLLHGLRENVAVIPENPTRLESTHSTCYDAAIVPYHHNMDSTLWRRSLAPIGRTFDCDVGFTGRRDYIYARSVLTKNLDLHEHENLERLFRMWPHWQRTLPPPTPINLSAADTVQATLLQAGIAKSYTVLQLGAGYPSKEWPISHWVALLNEFLPQTQTPLVLIGDQVWRQAGDAIAQQFCHTFPILNLVSKTTTDELVALIAGASFFIGGCSGPKHLAIMYRVPTFTIYIATEPHRWGATEDHQLHSYANAVPVKLTAMELQGLPENHRSKLLDPHHVAQLALHHYYNMFSAGT